SSSASWDFVVLDLLEVCLVEGFPTPVEQPTAISACAAIRRKKIKEMGRVSILMLPITRRARSNKSTIGFIGSRRQDHCKRFVDPNDARRGRYREEERSSS